MIVFYKIYPNNLNFYGLRISHYIIKITKLNNKSSISKEVIV